MSGLGVLTVMLLSTAPPDPSALHPGWATASGLRVATLVGASEQAAASEPDREQLLKAQRTLKVATAGGLLLTGTLGTLLALNRDTLLWTGRCSDSPGRAIFGAYGCNELSIVHGISAVLSLVLYTSTAAVSLSIPGEPRDLPTGRPGVNGAFYSVVSWIHLVGIVPQPILGFIASYPGLVGVSVDRSDDVSRALRTVHLGLGYVTIAAFSTSLGIELANP